MKKTILIVLIVGLIAVTAPQAHSAAPQWTFDPVHSGLFFDIRHIYSATRGYFEAYSGDFRFDPDKPEASQFDIVVKTKSLTTHHDRRDKHVFSEDFLDVKQFPEIRFKSNNIRRIDGNQYEVEGALTIKDVTKTVTIPFDFLGVRDNPFDSKQLVAGFEGRITIDRLEYNVGSGKYYEMGAVGKDVDILISLEMLRDK